MLSEILKAIVILAVAAIFAAGILGFYKKIRNLTKSKTKAELKKLRIFRLGAFVFAIVICFAYALASYFDTSKQASAVIGLNYAEASLGQNSNGTR